MSWTMRLAASFGWLLLLAGSIASAVVVLPRSWHDLDDANVRMQIFRIHGYDGDFIWSATAFVTNVVVVAAMLACCAWMLRILIGRWNIPRGAGERQQ